MLYCLLGLLYCLLGSVLSACWELFLIISHSLDLYYYLVQQMLTLGLEELRAPLVTVHLTLKFIIGEQLSKLGTMSPEVSPYPTLVIDPLNDSEEFPRGAILVAGSDHDEPASSL